MRTVTLTIAKLGLSIENTITLQLVDSLGNVIIDNTGYFLDETIVLDTDIFQIELKENNYINILSTYKLTLPNGLNFNFKVHTSFANTPHDLISLLQIACYAGIVEIKNEDEISLSASFVEKLNIYFTGENPYFTNTEKDLVNLYEYYADEIKYTTSTIDIVRLMDEYLATLGVI
ncbi:MAG: hypothetical protein Q9M40_07145 [Sulfurimonas sp.]|nr:hypothetical protein [Sulfurimonas sp.]